MPSVETTMSKRLETPGADGWNRSAHPGDPDKYFIVSADCHANEPKDWVKSRIAPEYLKRLPRLEMRDGQAFIITEGNRPWKIKTDTTDWGLLQTMICQPALSPTPFSVVQRSHRHAQ